MATPTSEPFWTKLFFRDFRQHFKRMTDAEIAADIRESMEKMDDLDGTGNSFGAKCVISAESIMSEASDRSRKNAQKRWAKGDKNGAVAGDGREAGKSGEQGVQDGANAQGQHSQGAKGHEDNPAEGREDRRTSSPAMGDKPEQEAQEEGGSEHGLPDRAREGALQPARQEAEVTQIRKPAESSLQAVFDAYPSKTITEPAKRPTSAVSGRKKVSPVGKSAMEMDHPEVYALWQSAPPMARQRSSPREVLAAWVEVRKHGAPSQEELLESIEAWKRSKKWAENGGDYIEGLHRWIKNRQWENTPLSSMQIATEQAKEADRELMEYMSRGY